MTTQKGTGVKIHSSVLLCPLSNLSLNIQRGLGPKLEKDKALCMLTPKPKYPTGPFNVIL